MLELQLAAVTTSLRHVTSCHFDTKYIFGAKATSILVDNSPSLVSRLQGKLDSDKVLVAISAAGLKEDISTDLAHAIWCERVYSVDRLLTATAIQQQYTLQQPMAPPIHRGTDSSCCQPLRSVRVIDRHCKRVVRVIDHNSTCKGDPALTHRVTFAGCRVTSSERPCSVTCTVE